MTEEKMVCNYYGCTRERYKDKHCIFHSEDEEKAMEFIDAFLKEFERQKEDEESFNFDFFIFPPNFDISGINFNKKVSFIGAQFIGEAVFAFSKFDDEALFMSTKFLRNVCFSQANFAGYASFYRATFEGVVEFKNTVFNMGAAFDSIKCKNNTYFNESIFLGKSTFTEAKFEGKLNLIAVNFTGVNLTNTDLRGSILCNANLQNTNVTGVKYDRKGKYRGIRLDGCYGNQRFVRHANDQAYLEEFKSEHPCLYRLWNWSSQCGRNIWLWTFWSIGVALIFALIFYGYYLHTPESFQAVYISRGFPFFSFLYYSVVTFTTLGFGDIVPKCGWLQMWVMVEVIAGYIMLGSLISILANKLARRS